MAWQRIFTEQYNQQAAKFIKSHPDVLAQYAKVLELLTINPHHPSLRLHGLQGRLEGLFSVSIHLKYRITLEMIMTDQDMILINVGDHRQGY